MNRGHCERSEAISWDCFVIPKAFGIPRNDNFLLMSIEQTIFILRGAPEGHEGLFMVHIQPEFKTYI